VRSRLARPSTITYSAGALSRGQGVFDAAVPLSPVTSCGSLHDAAAVCEAAPPPPPAPHLLDRVRGCAPRHYSRMKLRLQCGPARISDRRYGPDGLPGSHGERDNGHEPPRATTSRTTRGVVGVRQHREAWLHCNASQIPPRYADRCSARPNSSSPYRKWRGSGAILSA
jgi:hypothetical protein